MKTQLIALAAVAGFAFAAPAFADAPLSVSLSAPVSAKVKVVADGAVFACEANACVASAAPSRALSVSACKAITSKAHVAVTAFGDGANTLSSEQLAKCNASVAMQTAAK